MEILVILSGFCKEKTNPNKANITVHGYLFIVHSKDNERQFEKTNPISGCLSVNSCLESKSIFETIVLCMASRIFRMYQAPSEKYQTGHHRGQSEPIRRGHPRKRH
jgi:hypothetical protein